MFITNEYFDGKVKSIAFRGKDKSATIGVMAAPGKDKLAVVSLQLSVKNKNCLRRFM